MARNGGNDPTASTRRRYKCAAGLDFGSRYLLTKLSEEPATRSRTGDSGAKARQVYSRTTRLDTLDGLTNSEIEISCCELRMRQPHDDRTACANDRHSSGRMVTLLVGDQWPEDEALMALEQRQDQSRKYRNWVDAFCGHAGQCADAVRSTSSEGIHGRLTSASTFREGENQARRVAEKNRVKKIRIGFAYDSMLSLRHELHELWLRRAIKQIEEIRRLERAGGNQDQRRYRGDKSLTIEPSQS